jgi:hypothetical protein
MSYDTRVHMCNPAVNQCVCSPDNFESQPHFLYHNALNMMAHSRMALVATWCYCS